MKKQIKIKKVKDSLKKYEMDFVLELWIQGLEIEAASAEEAIDKLGEMSDSDIINDPNAYVKDYEINTVDAERKDEDIEDSIKNDNSKIFAVWYADDYYDMYIAADEEDAYAQFEEDISSEGIHAYDYDEDVDVIEVNEKTNKDLYDEERYQELLEELHDQPIEDSKEELWEGWSLEDIIDELTEPFEIIAASEDKFETAGHLKQWLKEQYPLNNMNRIKNYDHVVSMVLRHFNNRMMKEFKGYRRYPIKVRSSVR